MKSAFKERQLSECAPGGTHQRPKRNASTKSLGATNGLHWMEEKDLKKALYASLNETKKARSVDENASEDSQEPSTKTASSSSTSNKTDDDPDTKRVRVHAQRKFAQGSNPSSPMPTPVKLLSSTGRDSKESVGPPADFLPRGRRPKTEDFLTFLCLRGTPVLPPSLDFMSIALNCSGSERSSSPDMEAAWNSTDSREKDNGHSGSVASSANSVDSRVAAQKAGRHGPRHPVRALASRGDESRRSSIDSRGAKGSSKHRTAAPDQKEVPGTPPKIRGTENVPLSKPVWPRSAAHAICEKYKQQRLAKSRSETNTTGGRELRSRIVMEATETLPLRKKSTNVKHQDVADGHSTCRKVLAPRNLGELKTRSDMKKQPCVQLKRLSPRSLASVKLRRTALAHTGVRCKGRSVGITPHVRKAKLVPPIVDYDSESERELSPLSPRMSPRMSPRVSSRRSPSVPSRMPLKVGAKVVTPKGAAGGRILRSAGGVTECARKKVNRGAAKRQIVSTLVARKLLSTAKSRFGRSKTIVRTSVFRRRTRSLGPVKDLPLVLPLPTKRRFVHAVNKKTEIDERKELRKGGESMFSKKNASEVPKSKRLQKSFVPMARGRVTSPAFHGLHAHECDRKVERATRSKDDKASCSKSSGPKRIVTRRQSELADTKDVKSKRLTRRASLDGVSNKSEKEIPKRTTSQSRCSTRHGGKEKRLKAQQPKTGARNDLLRRDALLSFSDSDDEPLIKKVKKALHCESNKVNSASAKPATVDARRRFLPSPVKQEPMELCQEDCSHKARLAKSSRSRGVLGEKSSPDIHKQRRMSVDASIYSRFSEPSPSLSEKIAEAAGDPLDPPADLDDLTSMSDGVEALDALAGEISEVMSGRLSFGCAQEIQSLMTSEFSGAFDENVTGAMLLGSRDGMGASLETGLNLIKREDGPSKADAMTNTSDEDIGFLCGSFGPYSPPSPEEVSVGTQTVTPPPSVRAGLKSAKPAVLDATQMKEKPCGGEQKMKKEALKRRLELVEELKKLKLTLSDRKTFPRDDEPASLVAAPTYRPSAEEFKDPIVYISKIRQEAQKFGICKIVPPPGFRPECKVMDDIRFTAHNQYIHKVLSRWGPNVLHTECIRRCFRNQGIADDHPPLIGGIELDLSHLYHTVQSFGGIQHVMEKKKWHRVADAMHIPRAAQDRVSKVDDAYCKYVLPYDLLSTEEKDRIKTQVVADYERQMMREASSDQQADDDEEEEFSTECVTKGRSMSLSVFSRVARNTMSMWYKQDPSAEEVEKDYWNLVKEQKRHVVVHAGNIDSSVHGSGFPTNRLVPFSKHPWNLKVFTNNPGTILRFMGPVSGVTIPTLHLSMLFTTGCWYRDPHCLPWIEYLHTGASKIWYSVPAQSSQRFHSAMNDIMPEVCKDTVIWLPSDCAMVPPPMLVGSGCPLSRTIQEKGEFVIIFPGVYTSTIACGYSVSESVYFATRDWLLNAAEHFEHIKASCEPPTFSLEKLLLGIATDLKENLETCQWSLPLLKKMCENEKRYRAQLSEMGLKTYERLPPAEVPDKKKPKKQLYMDEDDRECEVCRTICYISMVVNSQDDTLYCLEHAVQELRRKNLKSWSLMYTYDMDEVRSIVQKLENYIEAEMENSSRAEASNKKKAIRKK